MSRAREEAEKWWETATTSSPFAAFEAGFRCACELVIEIMRQTGRQDRVILVNWPELIRRELLGEEKCDLPP
jgi:hypothetical protein